MHFLISAGPTREFIDPVRFLSNGSSGKMGYACAAAAVRRGHKAVLVSGPVTQEKSKGVKLIKVITAAEMAQAMFEQFERCDVVIMTAAVCDYRPRRHYKHKMPKAGSIMSLELERTEDILAELNRRKDKQILIGFAVQDRAGRQNARRKLKQKNLDAIVLNHPSAMGADRNEAAILQRGKKWEDFPAIQKNVLADKLIRLAEQLKVK